MSRGEECLKPESSRDIRTVLGGKSQVGGGGGWGGEREGDGVVYGEGVVGMQKEKGTKAFYKAMVLFCIGHENTVDFSILTRRGT